MIPKQLNTTKFIKYCEKNMIYAVNERKGKTFLIDELLEEYNKKETKEDIKKNLHTIIQNEVELYNEVPKMTPSALADHLLKQILSDNTLNLIKTYIKQTEDW